MDHHSLLQGYSFALLWQPVVIHCLMGKKLTLECICNDNTEEQFAYYVCSFVMNIALFVRHEYSVSSPLVLECN
jgi:hypothetical protein